MDRSKWKLDGSKWKLNRRWKYDLSLYPAHYNLVNTKKMEQINTPFRVTPHLTSCMITIKFDALMMSHSLQNSFMHITKLKLVIFLLLQTNILSHTQKPRNRTPWCQPICVPYSSVEIGEYTATSITIVFVTSHGRLLHCTGLVTL